MAVINRTEYAKWLSFEIDFYGKYHHHKEIMAWVITALYVPSIIYLGYRGRAIWQSISLEWIAPVLIFFAGYFVFIFTHMQFSNRWQAADAVIILMQRYNDLNRGGKMPRQGEWRYKEDDHWPCFVRNGMKQLNRGERNCWKAFIALVKMLSWFWWKKCKGDDRWKTELPSYIFIIFATLFAMYLAWN